MFGIWNTFWRGNDRFVAKMPRIDIILPPRALFVQHKFDSCQSLIELFYMIILHLFAVLY